MNFQQVTVKHTAFPVLAGGKERRKNNKGPWYEFLLCGKSEKEGFLQKYHVISWHVDD